MLRSRKNRVVFLTRSWMLEEELPWATKPLPGTSEDHPPLGGKPSEVEVGEEAMAIPPAISAARYNFAR